MTQDLEVGFESLTLWDVNAISTDIATWLSDLPATAKSASRVGILASSTFQRLISPLVKDSLSKHARLLMEISLALRSSGRAAPYVGYTPEELLQLQSFFGTKVIQDLETALKNPFDKSLLGDQGRALFLTLFSVIIAVANYSPRPANSAEVTSHTLYTLLILLTHSHSLLDQTQQLRSASRSNSKCSAFSPTT